MNNYHIKELHAHRQQQIAEYIIELNNEYGERML